MHIAEGAPRRDATKIWITSSGRAMLCNNRSRIPPRLLDRMLRVIEANSADFIQAWLDHFRQIRYYC